MRHVPSTLRAFRLLVLCLVVLLPGPDESHALPQAPQEIGVEPVQGFKISTPPGKLLTVAFRITNSTLRISHCRAGAQLPPAWRLIAPDTSFDVHSGGSEVRLLTFAVPSGCSAGEYEVIYDVWGDSADEKPSRAALTVVVNPQRALILRPADVPRFVLAGDSYTTRFSLTNEGNVATTVLLKTRSIQSGQPTTDSSRLHMQPGERRMVPVRCLTPSSLTRKALEVVMLVATAEEDSLVSVSTSSSTSIVPASTANVDLYHRLPVRATLRGSGENEKSGIQGEVSGTGTSLERGSDYIDFLFRGVDLMSVSTLGPHDEYRLAYQRQGVSAYLGDQVYRLTPLTEFGRTAFGGGASLDVDDVTIGGFYNRTRWTALPEVESAASVAYHVDREAEVSMNYLGKSRDSTSTILSLRTRVNPFSTHVIDLEYARGFIPSGSPPALSLRMNGREDWGYYDLQYLRAEPGFTGYYRDVDFINGNLIVFPHDRFRVEALIRNESRNLDRDPRYYSAPRFRYYQFGAGYANYLTLYYKSSATTDELPVHRFDTRESSVMAIGSYGFPMGSILATLEFGRLREEVLNASGPFSRLALFPSTTIARSYTVGLNLQYANDYNLYSRSTTKRFNGGASLAASIGASTRIFASATLSRFLNGISHWYSILDANIIQELPWGHTVALRGRFSRYNQFGQGTSSAWLAEYTLPIDFAASKKSSIGQLRGRLLDTETGTGIRNVLISVDGSMALTDESGEFFFPALPPGIHDLTIDQATLGYERVLTRETPRMVTIHGGDELEVTVGVVRSAQVSGSVRRFDFDLVGDSLQPVLREAGVQSGVLIEVRSSGRFLRQMTDSKGGFVMTGLTPGEWDLRILGGDIPDYHYFERDSLKVRLTPGEKADLTLKLLPKQRKIQLLSPGQLSTQTGAEPRTTLTPPPSSQNRQKEAVLSGASE